MPFNECTPKSVMADFLASQKNKGLEVPEDLILNGTSNELLSFVKRSQQELGDVLDAAPESLQKVSNKKVGNYWSSVVQDINPKVASDFYATPDGHVLSQSTIKTFGHTFMNPSQILGEDLVAPLDEILVGLASKGVFDGAEYKRVVKNYFDAVDTSGFNDGQYIYYNEYRDALKDSSRFTTKGKDGDILANKIDAIVKGTVQLSPTVIGGNLIEPFMKGIPIYGKSFLRGIQDLSRHGNGNLMENLFAEIPELKQQGLYGIEQAGDIETGLLERASGFMDRPAKNLMYFVGVADGGNAAAGRKAIQQVMFLPRMADVPLSYKQPMTRSLTRLLNYSISTYNLFTSTILAAKSNPSPENVNRMLGLLATYGTVSGIPAIMEAGGEDFENIPFVGPIWKAMDSVPYVNPWKAVASVSSVNVVNRVGIPISQFNNMVVAPISKAVTKIATFQYADLDAEDIAKLGLALTFSVAPNGSAGEELMSNQLLNRAVKNSIKGITGEKEGVEAFMDTILPSYNR